MEYRHDLPSDQRGPASALLQKLIKNRIGVTVAVEVVEPAALIRSTGKAKRVIDNRPKD